MTGGRAEIMELIKDVEKTVGRLLAFSRMMFEMVQEGFFGDEREEIRSLMNRFQHRLNGAVIFLSSDIEKTDVSTDKLEELAGEVRKDAENLITFSNAMLEIASKEIPYEERESFVHLLFVYRRRIGELIGTLINRLRDRCCCEKKAREALNDAEGEGNEDRDSSKNEGNQGSVS